MSTQRQECIIVECDKCADGWVNDDYGCPHWTGITEAEAEQKTIDEWGWTRRDDERLFCPDCSTAADCETNGHQWTRWRGPVPGVAWQWRDCIHCNRADEKRGLTEAKP